MCGGAGGRFCRRNRRQRGVGWLLHHPREWDKRGGHGRASGRRCGRLWRTSSHHPGQQCRYHASHRLRNCHRSKPPFMPYCAHYTRLCLLRDRLWLCRRWMYATVLVDSR